MLLLTMPSSTSEAMKSLECCIADRVWVLRNRLKLVDVKPEMIIFSSPRVKLPALGAAVCGESLQSACQLRNLGVTLGVHLTVNAHLEQVCQVSYLNYPTYVCICNC